MVHGLTKDPLKTLSPLARPGKALAFEAQIEPWSAIIAEVAAFQFPRENQGSTERRMFGALDHDLVLNGEGLAATIVFSV